MNKRSDQRGAVSLFIVILSALLITTISVGFIRLMVQQQEQASMDNLSKSALDSAQAGVEDAKRAIIKYQTICGGSDGSSDCAQLGAALRAGKCDTIQKANIAGSQTQNEVIVRQAEGDGSDLLDQAYTCVKVRMDTDNVVGSASSVSYQLIPLQSVDPVDEITISWYTQADLQGSDATTAQSVTAPKISLGLDASLPKAEDWPKNRPAVLRTQLIQYDDTSGFKLSDFDSDSGSQTNNATLFLMPSQVGSSADDPTPLDFNFDKRQSRDSGSLQQVKCQTDFSAVTADGQYACTARIHLPEPIGGLADNNRHAFLRINQIYNANTSFLVRMQNSSDRQKNVDFKSVQPEVDSTGRASDFFRRVISRVQLQSSSIPSAQAAVDITGNLCKSFLVTNDIDSYDPGACSDAAASSAP